MSNTDKDTRDLKRANHIAGVVESGIHHTNRAMLNQIIDSIADPIFVKDEELIWILVNQAFCDFLGYAREALIGHTDADLLPPEEAAIFNAIDKHVLESTEPNINEEILTSAATGRQHIIRTTKTMFKDKAGQRILVGIFTDLTELRTAQQELERANARLRQLALSDALTGLPNRRAFEGALEICVSHSQRHAHQFAVLFLDLNGFKKINDTYGHDVGDDLIKVIGERLAQVARANDLIARLGGDEFVVIAKNTDDKGAEALGLRIAASIAQPIHFSCAEISVSASIGIACFPHNADNASELIRKADQAMYHTKRVTQQPVTFYKDIPLAATG